MQITRIVAPGQRGAQSLPDQSGSKLEFYLGVRPMAFEQNADGSTKRMFVQLTEFHGFAVVDLQVQ